MFYNIWNAVFAILMQIPGVIAGDPDYRLRPDICVYYVP